MGEKVPKMEFYRHFLLSCKLNSIGLTDYRKLPKSIRNCLTFKLALAVLKSTHQQSTMWWLPLATSITTNYLFYLVRRLALPSHIAAATSRAVNLLPSRPQIFTFSLPQQCWLFASWDSTPTNQCDVTQLLLLALLVRVYRFSQPIVVRWKNLNLFQASIDPFSQCL